MQKITPITGTFLDEISHDINHQNWGEQEWDNDFASMKTAGIDTVILIRSGYQRWITYPSAYLMKEHGCHEPYEDLVAMFLRLSEKHGMKFYFGLYDSGKYWTGKDYETETAINLRVIDEVFERYGHSQAFGGWYFSHEINRNEMGVVEEYVKLGEHCKNLQDLPILISPYIDGKKAVMAEDSHLTKENPITLEGHRQEWGHVLSNVKDVVDIIAFQDGHVDYDELESFMRVNKELSDQYGIDCWTNCESFDRDMPIKFLPIKWEKMWHKLKTAQKVGIENAITFEFSHFMSPNSSYPQAKNLYNRYLECLNRQL
ncbi:MAG: DUF4434 domain-containing protein [Bacteroidota bacterium]